jgi:hypothetical protein
VFDGASVAPAISNEITGRAGASTARRSTRPEPAFAHRELTRPRGGKRAKAEMVRPLNAASLRSTGIGRAHSNYPAMPDPDAVWRATRSRLQHSAKRCVT